MDKALKRLCDLLDEELERQENILVVCRRKHEAIRSMDVPTLETRTKALEVLARETMDAEPERRRALEEAAHLAGLARRGCTLSALAEAVPAPWAARLRMFQRQLKETLDQTRAVAREYARDLRRAKRIADQHIAHMTGEPAPHKGLYGATGALPPRRGATMALVDQRG